MPAPPRPPHLARRLRCTLQTRSAALQPCWVRPTRSSPSQMSGRPRWPPRWPSGTRGCSRSRRRHSCRLPTSSMATTAGGQWLHPMPPAPPPHQPSLLFAAACVLRTRTPPCGASPARWGLASTMRRPRCSRGCCSGTGMALRWRMCQPRRDWRRCWRTTRTVSGRSCAPPPPRSPKQPRQLRQRGQPRLTPRAARGALSRRSPLQTRRP